MKIATTTADLLNGVYAKTPAEAVRLLRETRWKHIDFHMPPAKDFDGKESSFYSKDDRAWKKIIEDAMEEAQKGGIDFVQAHGISNQILFYMSDEQREKETLYYRNQIEACKMLGIKNIVMHGAFSGTEITDKRFELNKKLYGSFLDKLVECDVNALIENGSTTGAEFLLGAIDYLKHPKVHAVWDVGHANYGGYDNYKEIKKLGSELYAVHIHDNFGKDGVIRSVNPIEADMHTMPYAGTLNYDKVLCGLLESGYKGYFTLEAVNPVKKYPFILFTREVWEKESRLINMPLKARILLEDVLYETSKCMLEAYNCFEE